MVENYSDFEEAGDEDQSWCISFDSGIERETNITYFAWRAIQDDDAVVEEI